MAGMSLVDEIKQKIDIVDLVGSYVTLKHAGKYYKANCPFHQEKTPSFVVSPDIQRWHCFGACHEGGDIFNFLMKWENIPFADAVKLLAQRAGIAYEPKGRALGHQDEDAERKSLIISLLDLAARYYCYLLTDTAHGATAREYLKSRDISLELAQTFQIGYAPDAWSNICDYLRKKGYKDQDILLTGLAVPKERGMYDRFRGRLMFPIHNPRGQVVGFSGRLIKQTIGEKDGGKYINTPETLVYHKRESLYGFAHTRDNIRKANTAIVVEGEFDLLAPYAKGITNIVAIKGSAFTDDQLKILRRSCERLILALDNDKAGFDALRKSTLDAQQYGFELYVCAIPDGKDPDEAVHKDLAGLKHALKHPIPVYDYIIDTLFESVDAEDPFSKKHFIESAIPFIDLIVNPIVRTHYVQKAAGLLAMSERDVLALLRDYKRPRTAQQPITPPSRDTDHPNRTEALIRRILSLLITLRSLGDVHERFYEIIHEDDIEVPAYREIFLRLRTYTGGTGADDSKQFAETLSPQIRPVYDELYLYASTVEGSDARYLLRLALEYKKAILSKRIKDTSESPTEDDSLLQSLNTDRVAVEKELAML